MPIYRINNKNILFIHVPKTGGTSVEEFLSAHAEPAFHNRGVKLLRPIRGAALTSALATQHFHGSLMEHLFPEGYFDYAFMIVREPVNRLVSEFNHWRDKGKIPYGTPFNVWAHAMMSLRHVAPSLSNNHFRPQVDFRCHGAEIFHFETGIQNIIGTLASRLGLPAPEAVPHKRKSNTRKISVARSVARRAARTYAEDYAAFGYQHPAIENMFPGFARTPA